MSLLEPTDIARRPSRPPLHSLLATHLALVVVQMAFAVNSVEGKLAMRPVVAGGGGVDPFALALARMLGAATFFQVVMRVLPGKPREREHPGSARHPLLQTLPLADHLRIAGLSVLGIVLNQTLFLVGLRLTNAFAAALLGATIPVFAATLAIAFRVERPSLQTGVGLALALAGVLWLTGIGTLDLGALAIAANCLSYAFYIVLSKRVIVRVGAMTVVTWIFTWGALMFAPIGGAALLHGARVWDARGWSLVAVIVVVPTILAYAANAWALGRSNPTLVTVYIYLQPLFAAILQWVQLDEPVATRAITAGAFILTGVTVVSFRPSLARRAGGERSAALEET